MRRAISTRRPIDHPRLRLHLAEALEVADGGLGLHLGYGMKGTV
jgi:hypothetical protein